MGTEKFLPLTLLGYEGFETRPTWGRRKIQDRVNCGRVAANTMGLVWLAEKVLSSPVRFNPVQSVGAEFMSVQFR